MRRITQYQNNFVGTGQGPVLGIAGFDYGYNKEGMRSYEQYTPGVNETNQQARSKVFAYDSLYQVTGVKYDVPNPIAEIQNPGSQAYFKQVAYDFDNSGNRNAVETTRWGVSVPETKNYQANSLNQYTQIDSGVFGYDQVGNMTQGIIYLDDLQNPGQKTPALAIFVYDYQNNLVRAEQAIDNQVLGTYIYDALGRRAYKNAWDRETSAYQATYFWYSGAECIEETGNAGNTIATYTFGIGIDEAISVEYPTTSEQYPQSGIYWYHADVLGSIVAITDSNGAVVERYKYDIYGEVTVLTPDGDTVRTESVIGNRILYTGREYDKETGLYYYRARYYHAQVGRFLSTDPIGVNRLGNLFAYVSNSVINFNDSYGLGPEDEKRVKFDNLYIRKFDQDKGEVVTTLNFNKLTDPSLQLILPEEYKEVMQIADNLKKGWMEMSYEEQAILSPFIVTALYFRQDIAESAGEGVTVPLGPCTVTHDDLKFEKDFDIVNETGQGGVKVKISGEEKFGQGNDKNMTVRSFTAKLTTDIKVNDNKQTVKTNIYYGETNSIKADGTVAGFDVDIDPTATSGIICNAGLLHEENDVNSTDKITLAFGYKYNDYRMLFAGKYGFRDTSLGEYSEDSGWKISLQYLLDDAYSQMLGCGKIGVNIDYGYEPFEEEPTIGAGFFFDK